jgi:flavodoxin
MMFMFDSPARRPLLSRLRLDILFKLGIILKGNSDTSAPRGGKSMKALVLYRSHYGNTAQVAETMAERLRAEGHDAAATDMRGRLPDMGGAGLILIGAPTRMARVTGRARRILKKIVRKGPRGVRVAIFDTYGPIPTDPAALEKGRKWLEPGAAGILHQLAKSLGLNVHPETLRCEVAGMKGPLKEGELDKARAFAAAVLALADK